MNIAEETRDIYLKQHSEVAENDRAMERFINMFSEEYFGFEKGYFKGKKVLDAGCGNTSKLLIALNHMGATDLTGVDLGDDFIEPAKKTFNAYKVDDSDLTLNSANILNLPFEDETFDCTFCHGVLLVLSNEEEVQQAISELSRVTKKGGSLYLMVACQGGLLEDAIYPAMREYYRNNPDFKELVDNISPQGMEEGFSHFKNIAERNGSDIHLESFDGLFDTDFTVTVKNILQPPSWLNLTFEFLEKELTKSSMVSINRCKRFVRRKNIRKYLAPLHYCHDSQLSKILYGDGSVEIMATKG